MTYLTKYEQLRLTTIITTNVNLEILSNSVKVYLYSLIRVIGAVWPDWLLFLKVLRQKNSGKNRQIIWHILEYLDRRHFTRKNCWYF